MDLLWKWIVEHSLLLLLTVGTGFSFIWLVQFREKLQMSGCTALLLSIFHTVCGVFSVTVFAFLESGFDVESVGNMSLFGGVFFMPAAYFAGARLTKRSVSEVFDIFTICMIFTIMCARINCIISGCCLGRGISGLKNVRWPTRESEVIFYLIVLIIFGRKIVQEKTYGEIYPIYMISYGVFRLVIESFRESSNAWGVIHPAHIWAIVTLALGLSIYYELQSRRKRRR